jgi:predicted NBD/HSP70 family sugar kinase
MEILGIDIGGSGIKGAPVNIETGELTAERHRIPTPQPSVPDANNCVILLNGNKNKLSRKVWL